MMSVLQCCWRTCGTSWCGQQRAHCRCANEASGRSPIGVPIGPVRGDMMCMFCGAGELLMSLRKYIDSGFLPLQGFWLLSVSSEVQLLRCYNRQGRKAKNRRSRDSYSNRAYSRTQTIRNTGTHNLPLHLTRATITTNDLSTLVLSLIHI